MFKNFMLVLIVSFLLVFLTVLGGFTNSKLQEQNRIITVRLEAPARRALIVRCCGRRSCRGGASTVPRPAKTSAATTTTTEAPTTTVDTTTIPPATTVTIPSTTTTTTPAPTTTTTTVPTTITVPTTVTIATTTTTVPTTVTIATTTITVPTTVTAAPTTTTVLTTIAVAITTTTVPTTIAVATTTTTVPTTVTAAATTTTVPTTIAADTTTTVPTPTTVATTTTTTKPTSTCPPLPTCPPQTCALNANMFDANNKLTLPPRSGVIKQGCGKTYVVTTIEANYLDAAKSCCSMNMSLLTVDTNAQLTCIQNVAATVPNFAAKYWTGVTYTCGDKYTWCSTNAYISAEAVAMEVRMGVAACMVLTDHALGLTDHPCTNLYPFICECREGKETAEEVSPRLIHCTDIPRSCPTCKSKDSIYPPQ